ncbi:adventurous-gliding motility protein Z-like [Branchiostoma lanceolatum]|uniref:adventurous-gliding motility protein Z-like n=1 Tax=Branchiostoma lanceolatum TaxID=7740 RepID=UPI00345323FE
MSLKDRRNSDGYKNWLRVGLALLATRDGLTDVTLRAARELHAELKDKLGDSVESCKCNPKKKQECDDCKPWRQELESYYKGAKSQIYWTNCTPNKWSKEPWEVAKVFMPRGQSTDNTGPQTSDTSALLNFIVHCKFCFKFVSANSSQKVIAVRNRAMHSADLTFSQKEFQDHMAALLNLMHDPKLGSDPAAQKAADEISKIQTEDFQIGADQACHDAEVRVLTDMMEDYRKSLALHEKELGDHATRLEALEQGRTSEEEVPSQAVNSILDIVNGNDDLQSVLKDKASELSTMLQQYQSRLGKVEGDVADIKDEVSQLDKTMTKQQAQLDDVTARVDDEISDVKADIGDVKTSVDDVKEDLTKVKQKLLEAPPGSPKPTAGASISCKNTLQEYLDKEKLPKAKYVRVEGDGSNTGQPPFTFKIVLQYKNALFRPDGGFASKKVATQKACELALQRLGQSHLTKDPTHFRAELQEFLKKQGQEPEIEVTQGEQGFCAEVRMTGRGEFPQGDTSSNKKEAEQSAAEKALLALGVPLPVLSVRPTKQASPVHGAKASNKDGIKATGGSRAVAMVTKDDTDYKAVLKEHVKKQKLQAPLYKTNPDIVTFLSTVTFKTAGAYQTTEPAKGKKEAEQNAANAVVRMLSIPFRDANYKGALQEFTSKVDSSNVPTYHTYKSQGGYVSVVRCKAITEACSFKVSIPEEPPNVPDELQAQLLSGNTMNEVKAAEQKVAKFALDILGVPYEAPKQVTTKDTSVPEMKGTEVNGLKAKTATEDVNVHSTTVALAPETKETISNPAAANPAPYTEAKQTRNDRPSSQEEVWRVATVSKASASYKDILQKYVQDQKLPSPRYKDVEGGETTLPAVSFKTRGAYQTTEPAKSKKEAEQNAAKAVTEMLKVTAKNNNYKGALQEYASKDSSSDIPKYYTYKLKDGYISVVRCQAITEPCSFNLVAPDGETDELQAVATTTSLSQGHLREKAKENVAKFAVDVLEILKQSPNQTADIAPEAKGPGKDEKDISARARVENAKGLKSATTTTAAPGTEASGASAGKVTAATAPDVANRAASRLQDDDKPAAAVDNADRNYKDILQQHVQKQGLQLPLPKYQESITDEKAFLPTVSFKTAGALQTPEAAPSKKDSEQNAAKSVIDLLEITSGNNSNYKGALQQYATKLDSTDIPKYTTYSCEGGFKTVVTCRAITEATGFEVPSEACTSKKEAQQRAARRAVELLDIL